MKKATKKATKTTPQANPADLLRELTADGIKLGKASKTAVREAIKSIRKAHRAHVHEIKNHDKIEAKKAKILEQIAKLKKFLKA